PIISPRVRGMTAAIPEEGQAPQMPGGSKKASLKDLTPQVQSFMRDCEGRFFFVDERSDEWRRFKNGMYLRDFDILKAIAADPRQPKNLRRSAFTLLERANVLPPGVTEKTIAKFLKGGKEEDATEPMATAKISPRVTSDLTRLPALPKNDAAIRGFLKKVYGTDANVYKIIPSDLNKNGRKRLFAIMEATKNKLARSIKKGSREHIELESAWKQIKNIFADKPIGFARRETGEQEFGSYVYDQFFASENPIKETAITHIPKQPLKPLVKEEEIKFYTSLAMEAYYT
ncbi:MAG: hypothetical protein NTY47_06080, partial [Candidatus Omnitrophica bacterium]|nr:hypothetical protein [Candidatus Omnitrophota bacterium]